MSATGHIRLTSHSGGFGALPINWGAPTATERGPVVGTTANRSHRNVIGTHSGTYGVYRALAVAAGTLSRGHRADLTDTSPDRRHRPLPGVERARTRSSRSIPWGALVAEVFAAELAAGFDIRPTIAVTKAHIHLAGGRRRDRGGRLTPRRPVPARRRFRRGHQGGPRAGLVAAGRRAAVRLSEATCAARCSRRPAACIPELVTRSDLEVFLPPIGGQTLYVFGKPRDLAIPAVTLTARVHDECNGSDVFGSDICTCRPYLTHAIEECIAARNAAASG